MAELTSEPRSGRWRELVADGHAAPLATLCLGAGIFAFNVFIVSTALPSAIREIGGLPLISWATTVYGVPAIVGGAAAALLKQRFGARMTMLVAGLLFLFGSLLTTLAPSMIVMLVGRAIQGTGEGVIAALCYALIPAMFPPRLVVKVMGAEALVWAVAAFGGPLLAGWVTETVSWRAAFLINIPLIVGFLVLVVLVVPKKMDDDPAGRLPIGRLATIAAGIMLIAVASIQASVLLASACVMLALALLVGTVLIDRRGAEKLFPSEAFRPSTTLGSAYWVILLMPVAHSSAGVYLVIALQEVWGFSPALAGAVGAVMALSWSGFALIAANGKRAGPSRTLMRAGPVLTAIGLAMMLTSLATGSFWLIVLSQLVIGAAFGLSWNFFSQTVMEAAPAEERDRASGLLPTLQSGGYAIGAALAGLVANSAGFGQAGHAAFDTVAVEWALGVGVAIALLATLASFGIRPVAEPAVL
jgi:MFS family permease